MYFFPLWLISLLSPFYSLGHHSEPSQSQKTCVPLSFHKSTQSFIGHLFKISARNMYSGIRLIRTPRGHTKVSVLTGFCIMRVNLEENDCMSFSASGQMKLSAISGIKQVSVEWGSTVVTHYYLQ